MRSLFGTQINAHWALPHYLKYTPNTQAPFASLKKQAETLFQLIYCERKLIFQLKKQAEKYGL